MIEVNADEILSGLYECQERFTFKCCMGSTRGKEHAPKITQIVKFLSYDKESPMETGIQMDMLHKFA